MKRHQRHFISSCFTSPIVEIVGSKRRHLFKEQKLPLSQRFILHMLLTFGNWLVIILNGILIYTISAPLKPEAACRIHHALFVNLKRQFLRQFPLQWFTTSLIWPGKLCFSLCSLEAESVLPQVLIWTILFYCFGYKKLSDSPFLILPLFWPGTEWWNQIGRDRRII